MSGLHWIRHGQGHHLLLIQGAAATYRHWGGRLITALGRGAEVAAYDHRGTGGSPDVNEPFTVADLADDAAGLLDDLRWEEVAVFGVSFGGLVAQELALRHPSRVSRLILGCTPSGAVTETLIEPPFAIRLGSSPTARARAMFEIGVKDSASLPPEAWLEYHTAVTTGPSAPRTSVFQVHALRNYGVSSHHRIDVPTLVVHGDADRLVDVSHGEQLAAGIPTASFVRRSAGHFFWLEDPEGTADLVQEFLDAACTGYGLRRSE